jgi:two-component system chemotaxis sensor kinase CheA
VADSENPFGVLLNDYVAECLPLADRVGESFLALERRWEDGDSGEDLLDPLKRTLHTLKGNSAMMGLVPIQSLAHVLEDLCGVLAHAPAARPAATTLLLRGGGLLADLIARAASGPTPSDLSATFVADAREFIATAATGTSPAPVISERRQADRRSRGHAELGEVGVDGAIATIRVDARKLDALLETFGEAMIASAGLKEASRAITSRGRNLAGAADLEHAMTALEKTLKRLEGALMTTRLLPVSTVLGRFPLMVRQLAQAEHKRVRLVPVRGDTQLDKTLLDHLGEPLVHLVTNAVIHGIELPKDRERSGKSAEAIVTISAAQRSDRVVLTVSDDGRGLNPEKLMLKAKALGALQPGATPSRDEIWALAFLPGLSTTEQVSALAGRGVGLDVVATSIRALGGTIEVASQPGRGTTFTLVLPLTLAVLRSLLVSVDGERYAVPLSDVAESIRIAPDAIHQIEGRGMMLWRDQVIPVADAGEVLGASVSQRGDRRYCIIVRSAGKRRGLLVDGLLGHQDVVVKTLDPALGRPPVISGATILGDGRVACILDTARFTEFRGAEPAVPMAMG